MGLNYSTLTNDPVSKRIASPINGGQSKGSSNGSNSIEQSRSQRNNGGNRTNGTTQSNNNNNNNLTSSSYDTVMAGGVDDGFRESLSKNGSTKGGFR
jgi:hypothetical protein